jgi:hypothetical protein
LFNELVSPFAHHSIKEFQLVFVVHIFAVLEIQVNDLRAAICKTMVQVLFAQIVTSLHITLFVF